MSDTRMRRSSSGAADPPSSEGRAAFRFDSRPDDSISGLVHRLAEQGSHLAEQQVKLIEAEVRSGIADIKESIADMAGAAILGLAGVGVLMMGFAYLLAEAMPLWLATLIVAAIALGGAWMMFAAGQKKLHSRSLNVDRTKDTLKRAPSAISGTSQEAHRHDR